MVIRAVDQDDIDITQEARGCHAAKPPSDNDDAFSRYGARETGRFFHRLASFDESGGQLGLSDKIVGKSESHDRHRRLLSLHRLDQDFLEREG